MATAVLIKRNLDVLSEKINKSYASSISALRTTLERAIECGGLLNEAKSQLKHGEWLPWLEENCPAISKSTAAGWMRLAKSNVQPGIHLGVKEAQKLLSGSTAERGANPVKTSSSGKKSHPAAETNGKPDDPVPQPPANDASHPLPIPEREPGDEPPEPEHRPGPEAESNGRPNSKLDFDDKIIDDAFRKLIKEVDNRARALKQMNSAYHTTCIHRLDAFMKAFKEWKATRR